MNYQSTKFIQTSVVLLMSVGLLVGAYIDGTQWVTITGVALANYAYHDVKQKGM